MEEIRRKRAVAIGLRARLPLITRVVALFVLVTGIVFVAISYYRLRNNKPFRLRSAAPELSKEITGIVEGYEQHIMKGDRLYLWLRASRDVTFSDGHHELENVNLAIYPPSGDKPDKISASRAIYDQKAAAISFLGKVKIETKDALEVDTESLVYNQDSEIAQTDDWVSFTRENISGHATGAVVEASNKKLELKKDVEIIVVPEVPKDSEVKLSSSHSGPITIRAARALFERELLKLSFSGGVTADQDREVMSGDKLYATFNERKRLEKVEARGNSYLRSMDEGHAAEVHSVDMDFFLDKDQRLERAVASRDTRARSLDSESEMELTGADAIEVSFQTQNDRSMLREMRTDGRSAITLSAPKSRANDARAANKRLTADSLKLVWRATGRDLERAEAVGNAELFVEPLAKNAGADLKTLTAPRFDCDFYESGNLARAFNATGGAKAIIQPVQGTVDRATRTLTAQKMIAVFVRDSQDVDRLDALGDGKFNERDRNGVAASMSYTAADDTVRLRGGEPTVWDSRARTKAVELDSDLQNDVSYSRGKTATTYYSQEQTNGATPFTKVKSPVYVVGDRGEFHHQIGMAIYTGNARAWQEDNFVRADKLTIYVNEKKMEANVRVQSALYNAKRKLEASTVPVFAAADSMWYSDLNHTLHYEGSVDIREATDRITSEVADIFLFTGTNEVEKTVAQRNVVLTQPNRRGTGDWVQYTSADEVAVLRGNPARIEDTEQGTTEGSRLTVNIREGRVTADDSRGPVSPGRVRSTHKVRKQ